MLVIQIKIEGEELRDMSHCQVTDFHLLNFWICPSGRRTPVRPRTLERQDQRQDRLRVHRNELRGGLDRIMSGFPSWAYSHCKLILDMWKWIDGFTGDLKVKTLLNLLMLLQIGKQSHIIMVE